MSRPRRQVLVGLIGAAGLCAIALAGADHPPPPGFLLLVAMIMSWTFVVSLIRWRTRDIALWHQWLLTSLGGSAAGLLAWLVLWMRTTPDSDVDGLGMIVGLLIVTLAGTAGATVLAVTSWVFVDRDAKS